MQRSRGGARAAPRSLVEGQRLAVPLLLLAVTLAGAALRAGPALFWPIRHDEVLTWLTAQADPAAFLLWTHHHHHPPLSYVLVRLSTTLLGTDAEWALRLPSLLAGVACIPLAYLVGRRFGSAAAGILLATLIAFDPLLVDQARQARMYSLYALLFLATLYGLARFTEARRIPRCRWVLMGMVLTAIFWTHVLGLVLWGGIALGIAIGRGNGRQRRAALKAMGLAVALSTVGLGWLWKRTPWALESSISGPEGFDPLILALRGLDSVYPGKLVAVLLLLAGLAGLIRLHRRDPFLSHVLLGTFALSILAAVVGAGDRAYGLYRYLLPLHLTAHVGLVCLATSLRRQRVRWTACLATALVALLWIPAVFPGDRAPRDYAVGALARELADHHVRPGHMVKYVPRMLHYLGRYYGLPFEKYVMVGRPLPADYPFETTWIVAGYGRALPNYSPDLPVTVHPELPHVLGPVARHYGVAYDEDRVKRLLIQHGAVAVAVDRGGIRYVAPASDQR